MNKKVGGLFSRQWYAKFFHKKQVIKRDEKPEKFFEGKFYSIRKRNLSLLKKAHKKQRTARLQVPRKQKIPLFCPHLLGNLPFFTSLRLMKSIRVSKQQRAHRGTSFNVPAEARIELCFYD